MEILQKIVGGQVGSSERVTGARRRKPRQEDSRKSAMDKVKNNVSLLNEIIK